MPKSTWTFPWWCVTSVATELLESWADRKRGEAQARRIHICSCIEDIESSQAILPSWHIMVRFTSSRLCADICWGTENPNLSLSKTWDKMVDRLFKRRERESRPCCTVCNCYGLLLSYTFFFMTWLIHKHTLIFPAGGAGRAINSCLCGGSRRPELPVQKKGHKFLKHHETATQQKVWTFCCKSNIITGTNFDVQRNPFAVHGPAIIISSQQGTLKLS